MGAARIRMPQQRINGAKLVRTARNQRKDVLLLAAPNLGIYEIWGVHTLHDSWLFQGAVWFDAYTGDVCTKLLQNNIISENKIPSLYNCITKVVEACRAIPLKYWSRYFRSVNFADCVGGILNVDPPHFSIFFWHDSYLAFLRIIACL